MEVGSVEAWQCDMESSKFIKLWSKGYPQEALCLYYDHVSKKILVGLDDGVVDLIQMKETGYDDTVCEKIHNGRITGLGYDSLTNVVFSVSQDKIFRISHGTSLAMVLGVPHKEQLLALFKDNINKRVFIGNKIGEILIYDIAHVLPPLFRLKNPSCWSLCATTKEDPSAAFIFKPAATISSVAASMTEKSTSSISTSQAAKNWQNSMLP